MSRLHLLKATSPNLLVVRADGERQYGPQKNPGRLKAQGENSQGSRILSAESYERYVELYDFSPVGYLTLTAKGKILQVNATCAELFGLPREQCLKRFLKNFVLPESYRRTDQMIAAAMTLNERQVAELTLKRVDGSVFDAELICRRMLTHSGLIVLHIALTDISERKANEQALRIAAIAFESQEGMLVMDSRRQVLRINGAFSKITAYPVADVLAHEFDLLDATRHDESFHAAIWDSANRFGIWQGEVWSKRKGQAAFPAWLTITAVKGSSSEITHYVVTLTDYTLRKAEEDNIKRLAFYDSLTQLPNRQHFLNRLQQALAASARTGREGALLFIDLDNFKALNDSLGHSMGDLLLQQVAQRLKTCIREDDTAARLGGDEFVVMLENLSANLQEAADQVEAVGEKILLALNRTYDLEGKAYHSTPSIGATLFQRHQGSVAELLKSADLAMYHAKAAGRNELRFFDLEMQVAVTARVKMEDEMREALRKGQFVIHYQAQVDNEGRWTGAEALLRWQHPERNLLFPVEFVSLAEDTGLIVQIGQQVLEAACRQLAVWADQPDMSHLTLAVNVSPREFRHPDFVLNVLSTLHRCGADPRKLCLEVTERLLGSDLEAITRKMATLKASGVRFALDNFGNGTSSLSDLKRLSFYQLKIGQPFIRNMPNDPNDLAIARSIVVLGDNLGVEVMAEGVETYAQRDALNGLGCFAYQGFLFSRTAPPDVLREMHLH